MLKFIFYNLCMASMHLVAGVVETIVITENRHEIEQIYETCVWIKLALACHFVSFLGHVTMACMRTTIIGNMELDYINIYRVFVESIVRSLVMASALLILGVTNGVGIEFIIISFYIYHWFNYYYNIYNIFTTKNLNESYVQIANTPLVINIVFLITTLVLFISTLIESFKRNDNFYDDSRFYQYILCLFIALVYFVTHLREMAYVTIIEKHKQASEDRVQRDVEGGDEDDIKLEMDTNLKSACLSLEFMHYIVTFLTVCMVSIPAAILFSTERPGSC